MCNGINGRKRGSHFVMRVRSCECRLESSLYGEPLEPREPFPEEDGAHFAPVRVPERRGGERKAPICVERVVVLRRLPSLCHVQIAILIMDYTALGRSQFPTTEIRNEAVR